MSVCVLTELVRLRFQQSGLSLFCSSARALACRVNARRSSLRIFFHLSPRRTLIALHAQTTYVTTQQTWIHNTDPHCTSQSAPTVPVVFAWVHVRVLHPELLGKQHEGVHWSLALTRCGIITSRCTVMLAFGWLSIRRVRLAGTAQVCGF